MTSVFGPPGFGEGIEVSRAFGPDDQPLVDLISSPHVPENTLYIVDRVNGLAQWSAGPMTIREDVWWEPAPTGLDEPALTERRRALEHLEQLLDRMCADVGLDPEKAWRQPRLDERDRAALSIRSWIMEQSVGLMINDPKSVLKITVT